MKGFLRILRNREPVKTTGPLKLYTQQIFVHIPRRDEGIAPCAVSSVPADPRRRSVPRRRGDLWSPAICADVPSPAVGATFGRPPIRARKAFPAHGEK